MQTPSSQLRLGQTVQITEIPVTNINVLPEHPLGEIKDVGLVSHVYTDHFNLILPNGKYRSYIKGAKHSVLDSPSLIKRFRKLINDHYDVLLSKGAGCKLGSDPEIFVCNKDGTVIPAWEFLPRVADHQPKRKSLANYLDAAAFWDGVQAEFTTVPAECLAYHIDSIQNGLVRVLEAARKFDPSCKLTHQSVMEVPQQYLDTADETHIMLGCAPSKNVYEDVEPIYIDNPRALRERFAGGHIHFGRGFAEESLPYTIRMLDSILAVSVTAMLSGLDDPRRRSYYGRAGEHRLPPHGLEYRTLPSTILYHPAVTHICFDLGRQTVWSAENGYTGLWKASEQETRECIDNSDAKLARKIVRRNIHYLRAVFMAIYRTTVQNPIQATTTALRLIMEGAGNLLPADIESNWKLSVPYSSHFGWIAHSEQSGASVVNLKI